MQVRDIMTRQLASCRPDADVQEVASLMVQCDSGAIPVVEPQSHKAIGVVTDRDIVCRAVAAGRNPVGMKAEQVMTMPVNSVGPDASLEECLARMESAQVRRMLVVDDGGALCGVVSTAVIARAVPGRETAELVRDVSKPTDRASNVH
jgi:CBS domain-containing protein